MSFVVVHHKVNSLYHQILQGHSTIHTDLVYSPGGHDVICYYQLAVVATTTKKLWNISPPTTVLNFNGTAFCLAVPIGGLLVLSHSHWGDFWKWPKILHTCCY